jgi:PAS domain S-box-containing protein
MSGTSALAAARRHRGGVARRFAVLFAFIGAILVVNAGVVYHYVSSGERAAPFFRVADHHRLLTQRIVFLTESRIEGGFGSRRPMEEALARYEESLRRIENGGVLEEMEVPPAPREVRPQIARLRDTWTRVRPMLERVAVVPPNPEARKAMDDGLTALLDGWFEIVVGLEAWRHSQRQRLLGMVAGASVAGLVALLAWFKLAWDHLVTPVRRLRDQALRVWDHEPVDLPGNEIEAVGQAVTELTSAMERLRRERGEVARELRRAEADYRSIFDNAVAGILRFDGAGTMLLANRALARILGFSSVEELTTTIEDVHRELFADPGHRSRFEDLHLRSGHVELETKVRRKDGSTLWVLESARAGAGLGGSRVYETVIVDITPMKKAQESLRELSGLLLQSQDRERRRIARELHDSTGQLLAALEINLGRLDEVMPVFRDSLESAIELSSECTRQIRSMSYLLHPPMLEELGLLYALRGYTRGFSQRSGIDVELESPAELSRFDSNSELALFRVVQEALANIQRHSGSGDAVVRIVPAPGWIRVEVEDHGCGIDAELLEPNGESSLVHMGVGMRGMEERLRQLGGRVHIESEPGRTVVCAEVPLSLEARSPSSEDEAGTGTAIS